MWAASAKRAISSPASADRRGERCVLVGRRGKRTAPHDDQRTLGRSERRNCRADIGGRSRRAGRFKRKPGGRRVERRGFAVYRVRVDFEIDRAGATASRAMQCLGDVARDRPGFGAGGCPFRNRSRDGSLVDVAHGTTTLAVAARAAREHHERDTPHPGVKEADQPVREARAGGDRRYSRVAGGERPALRSEHRRALVARVDDPDVLVKTRVEKRQDMAPRKGEDR
jgi:hypothetical protein